MDDQELLKRITVNPAIYPSYHDLASDLIEIVRRVIWVGRLA